ncbi:hypothetical protein [Egicoccus sp. AB-alg6-2]|uniref:hypothetical protein n=1 Tax=Egicoccus sp. AB-alg6-2 TaxID=3242692 RepID=UPI00359D26E5
MHTRTYLTTPPGRVPLLDAFPDGVVERWVPGPAVPTEPASPGRRRRYVVAVALLLGALLLSTLQAVADRQTQDPALSLTSAGQR